MSFACVLIPVNHIALFDLGEVLLVFAFAGALRALALEVFFTGLVFFDALRALDFRAPFLATLSSYRVSKSLTRVGPVE